jgi:hypothetical protein
MDKFGRNYVLEIETAGGKTVTVKPPFTVEFDIQRNDFSSSNVASFRIWNLNPDHRNQVRKNINDFTKFIAVTFRAGYGGNLPVCFSGNINEAWSVREGVDFITEIQCYDFGFLFVNAQTNRSFGATTPLKDVIKEVASDLAVQLPDGTVKKIDVGIIGKSFEGTLTRDNSYCGATINILRELTGDSFFVDLGKLNVLSQTETLKALGISVISPATGLLNTPHLEQSILRFEMLFEPRLVVGQSIKLEGVGERALNGLHKVTSIHHHGMISDAVCGEAITEAGFFAPLLGTQLDEQNRSA